MNLQKFDYVVDTTHPIISMGDLSKDILSDLCPVLVARLTDEISRYSNARLYIVHDRALGLVELASLARQLGDLPPDIAIKATSTSILLAVMGVELAKRYIDGTLDPIYHAGDDPSLAAANIAYKAEKDAATTAEAVA